jgi:hypothetical protein
MGTNMISKGSKMVSGGLHVGQLINEHTQEQMRVNPASPELLESTVIV